MPTLSSTSTRTGRTASTTSALASTRRCLWLRTRDSLSPRFSPSKSQFSLPSLLRFSSISQEPLPAPPPKSSPASDIESSDLLDQYLTLFTLIIAKLFHLKYL